MFVYAHRGSSGLFPENTMAAFRAAVDEGAGGIETDLRLTADKVVVLSHDPEIVSREGVLLKVAGHSFDELCRATGGALPMLDELMAFASGRIRVNLEIKDPAVLPFIGPYLEKGEGILVTSFDRELMLTVAKKYPRVEAGPVMDVFGRAEREYLKNSGFGAVSLWADVTDRAAVRFCKNIGLRVNVWVVNDAGTALRLKRLGVDGVFSDRPGELVMALGIADAALEACRLHDEAALYADPARADAEKRYLKSGLAHLGVKVPVLRAIAVRYLAGKPLARAPDLRRLALSMWESGFHEDRVMAVMLLNEGAALLGPEDMAFMEGLLKRSGTWALVDALSTGAVAGLFGRYPDETGPVLDAWSGDGDFWVRRASLLALLPGIRSGKGDFGRFGRYADKMLGEREFFIRKAIGWVLRETGKKRPELVAGWLSERAGRVSGLTMREAVKYLPLKDRETIGRR